jgi:hypothetical protein
VLAVVSLRLADYRLPSESATLALHTAILESWFTACVTANRAFLRTAPSTPLLYRSGVRYHREGVECWRDIPSILRAGQDDCEGLACWLAAEMCERAPHSEGPTRAATARVVLRPSSRHTHGLWHAVVRADGREYDPSRRLGMRGTS